MPTPACRGPAPGLRRPLPDGLGEPFSQAAGPPRRRLCSTSASSHRWPPCKVALLPGSGFTPDLTGCSPAANLGGYGRIALISLAAQPSTACIRACTRVHAAHLISRSTWRLRSSGIGLLCCRANTAGSCPGSLLGCIAFGARHYMLPRPALHSSSSISLLRKSSRRTAMSSSNGVRAPDPSSCDWSRSSLSQSTMD